MIIDKVVGASADIVQKVVIMIDRRGSLIGVACVMNDSVLNIILIRILILIRDQLSE